MPETRPVKCGWEANPVQYPLKGALQVNCSETSPSSDVGCGNARPTGRPLGSVPLMLSSPHTRPRQCSAALHSARLLPPPPPEPHRRFAVRTAPHCAALACIVICHSSQLAPNTQQRPCGLSPACTMPPATAAASSAVSRKLRYSYFSPTRLPAGHSTAGWVVVGGGAGGWSGSGHRGLKVVCVDVGAVPWKRRWGWLPSSRGGVLFVVLPFHPGGSSS